MTHHRVWDPFIRVFHWSVVTLFFANAFVIDDDSKLHHYVGYAVAAALVLRLAWGLIGPTYARFAQFAPSPAGVTAQLSDMATGRKRAHLGHTPLGALMIFNLLLSLAGIALTGYLMTTDMFWGVAWPEDIHEALVTWTEISIVLHVVAVIWESRRTGVNLPRAMVTGTKDIPDGLQIEP
ncbi:cytochrome b/b6 domain-containing protein [Sagittula sp. NFXS13]|uniref:cytochrome b/b6 domain-containing protein n=1 Tax=Sagittula sp. NFXS13 TaxID=2819095 RepID=UPI0032E050F6